MFYMDWASANPITFWLIFIAGLAFAGVGIGALVQWYADRRNYRAWRDSDYKRFRPR